MKPTFRYLLRGLFLFCLVNSVINPLVTESMLAVTVGTRGGHFTSLGNNILCNLALDLQILIEMCHCC